MKDSMTIVMLYNLLVASFPICKPKSETLNRTADAVRLDELLRPGYHQKIQFRASAFDDAILITGSIPLSFIISLCIIGVRYKINGKIFSG